MKCPKCGAVQPDGRTECSACGIVFARWQAIPTRTRPGTPLPPQSESAQPVPIAFIAIAALLILLAGLVWNKHRQSTKANEANADEMINAINNQQVARMKERQKELQQNARAAAPPQPSTSGVTPPPDFDIQTLRTELERCSFFGQPVIVNLPKSFRANFWAWTLDRYPALPAVVRVGYAHYDPPFDTRTVSRTAADPVHPGDQINVVLTAPPSLNPTDTGDEYHLDLGRRHIETMTPIQVNDVSMRVMLTWSFERGEAASLMPEGDDRGGGADFDRKGGRWTVRGAWRNTPRETFDVMCH